MENDPERADEPCDPERASSGEDGTGEDQPTHRREFLRLLGSMTFLTAGLEKLGSLGAADPQPNCGLQVVEGGPAVQDLDCGVNLWNYVDADCSKPNFAGGNHQDDDCGLSNLAGGANQDRDCMLPEYNDDDCGKAVPLSPTKGHQDNECCGPPADAGDGDCGIGSGGGHAHSDEFCGPYATDSDCGKSKYGGGAHYDSDCGGGAPVVSHDSDCSRMPASGAPLSGDQDCSVTGRDSTCSANDLLLEPGPPDPPLP